MSQQNSHLCEFCLKRKLVSDFSKTQLEMKNSKCKQCTLSNDLLAGLAAAKNSCAGVEIREKEGAEKHIPEFSQKQLKKKDCLQYRQSTPPNELLAASIARNSETYVYPEVEVREKEKIAGHAAGSIKNDERKRQHFPQSRQKKFFEGYNVLYDFPLISRNVSLTNLNRTRLPSSKFHKTRPGR